MELNQGTGNMTKKGQTGTKREHTFDRTPIREGGRELEQG